LLQPGIKNDPSYNIPTKLCCTLRNYVSSCQTYQTHHATSCKDTAATGVRDDDDKLLIYNHIVQAVPYCTDTASVALQFATGLLNDQINRLKQHCIK